MRLPDRSDPCYPRLWEFIARYALTPASVKLMMETDLQPSPPHDLVRWTAEGFPDQEINEPPEWRITLDDVERAWQSLCERGMLEVLSSTQIVLRTAFVAQCGDAGPYDRPMVPGNVEFTAIGAECWLALRREVFGIDHEQVDEEVLCFVQTGEDYFEMISTRVTGEWGLLDEAGEPTEVIRSIPSTRSMASPGLLGPVPNPRRIVSWSAVAPTGPWRSRWWARHPRGYRCTFYME